MSATADGKTRIVAVPAARIAGRVVTKLPGVDVTGLKAFFQDSHLPGRYTPGKNFDGTVLTDADGRFTIDGLSAGLVNVTIDGGIDNRDWTYRAANMVELKAGTTTEVTFELIRGVEIEGTVVAGKTGVPLPEVQLALRGTSGPRSSGAVAGGKTDSTGRYRCRVPSGETYIYVFGPPHGFTRLRGDGSSRTVTIPEGTLKFELPPIELAPAATLRGHVFDAGDKPIVGAKVVGICENGLCRPFPGQETVTDVRGEFRLPPGMYNTVAIGKPARLLIRLRDGAEHEAVATPAADGAVNIKLPTGGAEIKGALGPRTVEPQANRGGAAAGATQPTASSRKFEGIILDPGGKPVAGATVVTGLLDEPEKPNHQVFQTDQDGRFNWSIPESKTTLYFVAYKNGFAPTIWPRYLQAGSQSERGEWKLRKPHTFAAVCADDGSWQCPGRPGRPLPLRWSE